MAPVESFTQRYEQEPESWFLLKPGEEKIDTDRFSLKDITTEMIVECDNGDIDGTVVVNTPRPDIVGVFLFENDDDHDPKPLEIGEKHHFSGTQRIEIHSTQHDEHVSLKHNVATGVVVNRIDVFEARTALARTKPVVDPKPILVGAAR